MTKSELFGLLLELHYDLLDDEEARTLRARIDAEPEVADAWKEVQETASLLQLAARAPAALPITLSPPESTPDDPKPSSPIPPVEYPKDHAPGPSLERRFHWGRWLNLSVAVAACLLLTTSFAGYYSFHSLLTTISDEKTRVVVSVPQTLFDHTPQQLAIQTTTPTGKPVSATIRAKFTDFGGKNKTERVGRTGDDGRLWMDLPVAGKNTPITDLDLIAERGGKTQTLKWSFLSSDSSDMVPFITTDRPLYRAGERVFYRAVVMNRLKTAMIDDDVSATFCVKKPSGEIVADSEVVTTFQKGVASGSIELPTSLPGGRYAVEIKGSDDHYSETKRDFQVLDFRVPRLKKELEFTQDSYGPGERVVADFSATRAEGGVAANATVRANVTLGHETIVSKSLQTDESGLARIEFQLPAKIELNDALLTVGIDDGGNIETMAKRIPLVLNSVDVQFYPEGGDLVADLENRVYFDALDAMAAPLSIEGEIVDPKGQVVAKVATEHDGMGYFRFTPKSSERYSLRVTKPASVTSPIQLPTADPSQTITLSSSKPAFDARESITLDIRSRNALRPLLVTANSGTVLVGQTFLVTKQGSNPVSVPVLAEASGVLRMTVHDCAGHDPYPIAERLVFRRPTRKLDVHLADGSPRYTPGESVELTLSARNENGENARGILGVAVVDDTLLSLNKEKSASMPTYFYLTNEVRDPEDLQDADFFLTEGQGRLGPRLALGHAGLVAHS
ncbi:MAG: MG2 domain-containing protein [Planctomycetota bacterium]